MEIRDSMRDYQLFRWTVIIPVILFLAPLLRHAASCFRILCMYTFLRLLNGDYPLEMRCIAAQPG